VPAGAIATAAGDAGEAVGKAGGETEVCVSTGIVDRGTIVATAGDLEEVHPALTTQPNTIKDKTRIQTPGFTGFMILYEVC